VLAGCDYLENVKGVGILTILEFFKSGKGLRNLEELVGRYLDEAELQEYRRNVEKTCLCFTFQLVYNREAKRDVERLVAANPLAEFTPFQRHTGTEDFTGRPFKFVESYARGERQFQNHLEFRPVHAINFDQLIRFYSYIPRPDTGFMTNLTTRTICHANFEDFQDVVDRSDQEEFMENLQATKSKLVLRSQNIAERIRLNLAANKSIASGSTFVSRRKRIVKTGRKRKARKIISKKSLRRIV
jgi:5'-3' exonuclease